MDYQEIISLIEKKKGNNHSFEQIRDWIEQSGYVKPEFSIQAAGTNGKGSVCKWLEIFFELAGYRCGLFTSPHLIEHTERIQIDGQKIGKEEFARLYHRIARLAQDNHLTMFEIDLLIAAMWFKENKVQAAIYETGLGGARDAVSALEHDALIITNIGLDHMELLGDSLKKIAVEKAGAIKSQKNPLKIVIGKKQPEIMDVFEKRAEEFHCPLVYARSREDLPESFDDLPAYQKENFLSALQVFEVLGLSLDQKQLEAAINSFAWPARFMILRKDPLILIDGAHNPQGIEALCHSLAQRKTEIAHIYFSALRDKMALRMIGFLREICDKITLVRFESDRIYDLEELSRSLNLKVIDVNELISRLEKSQEPVLCCGSLYLMAELLRAFEGR